jgi:hypothetical protein
VTSPRKNLRRSDLSLPGRACNDPPTAVHRMNQFIAADSVHSPSRQADRLSQDGAIARETGRPFAKSHSPLIAPLDEAAKRQRPPNELGDPFLTSVLCGLGHLPGTLGLVPMARQLLGGQIDLVEPPPFRSPRPHSRRVRPFCCLHGAVDICDEGFVDAAWMLDAGRIEHADASLDHLGCDFDLVRLGRHCRLSRRVQSPGASEKH